ncbi:TPA: hypothetical protein SLO28_002130 [Klebsiella pneumoniae]|uniref:hypothetical protein n=1 Tax=Klebsiella pneumoniae TaxID=573 RepID=UPI000B40B9F0|nr:hypothetical protein [Klebsiella pneumoniae]ELA0608032.1 hypothetical protein [Klebsiella pneumoniae]OVW48369.1 hypothetical protein BME48_23820 [Klebsiella pneumoniae]HBS9968727.1 hypothetical protein [Klebsiella pneumoniae]HCT5997987.1 hypothetical protein [Klebsiella pneumoniae]HCT8692680.1 hypothetical protein [Klebsiella pneumoniae]
MTTDITELAQSLKAAAEKWQEAWGKYDKVEITIAAFIRAANQYESIVKDPANIIALVEALEKAQQTEKTLESRNRRLDGIITAAEKRIAELESRAVTVENLQESAYRAGLTAGWNLGLANNNDGFNKCLAAHAAGIKVEAE